MRLRRRMVTGTLLLCLALCAPARGAGLVADDHPFPAPGLDTHDARAAFAPNGWAIVAWTEQVDASTSQVNVATRPPGGDWSAPAVMGTTNAMLIIDPEVAINNDGAAAVSFREGINATNIAFVSTRPAGGSFTAPESLNDASPSGVGIDAGGVVSLLYQVYSGADPGAWVNTAPAGASLFGGSSHKLDDFCSVSSIDEAPSGDAVVALYCGGVSFSVRRNGTWTRSDPFVNNPVQCPAGGTSTSYAPGDAAIDSAGHAVAVVIRTDSTHDCGGFLPDTDKRYLILATLAGGAMAAGPTIAEGGTAIDHGDAPNDVAAPTIGIGGGTAIVGWFVRDNNAMNPEPVARVYGGNGADAPGPVEPVPGALPVTRFGQLAVAANGGALFSWSQQLGGKDTVYVSARPPGGPFGAPLQTGDGAADSMLSAVRMSDSGDGLITWLEGNPARRVHARGFDATPPTLENVTIPAVAPVTAPTAFGAEASDLWGPVTFGWDFADGTATGPAPMHAFSAAGAHNVTVTATDSAGNASSQSSSVNVLPLPSTPVAVAPLLSGLTLTHRVFRVGRAATAISASARKKRIPVGTTFKFRLDKAGSVAIRIDRALPGRRLGGRCVAPTKKLRRAKRCTRYKRAGTLTRRGAAGANKVAFSGRIAKKALAPGSYRATLTPSVPGALGVARKVGFRIVR